MLPDIRDSISRHDVANLLLDLAKPSQCNTDSTVRWNRTDHPDLQTPLSQDTVFNSGLPICSENCRESLVSHQPGSNYAFKKETRLQQVFHNGIFYLFFTFFCIVYRTSL